MVTKIIVRRVQDITGKFVFKDRSWSHPPSTQSLATGGRPRARQGRRLLPLDPDSGLSSSTWFNLEDFPGHL